VDVRGFTPFCQSVDSAEAGLFIKETYIKLIDGYFKNAFIKLTGDGLVVIYEYQEGKAPEIAHWIVETCLRLVKDFGSFFADDEVMSACNPPNRVGIGVSIGPVCCLLSGEKVLDYSGRPLNLASRLMNMARPMGLVVDDRVGRALMRTDLKDRFAVKQVYAHGVAEQKPIRVYYSKEHTLIPSIYLHPLQDPRWGTCTYIFSLRQLKELSDGKQIAEVPEEHKVLDPSQAELRVYFPRSIRKKLGAEMFRYGSEHFRHSIQAGRDTFTFNVKLVADMLIAKGAKDGDRIRTELLYPLRS